MQAAPAAYLMHSQREGSGCPDVEGMCPWDGHTGQHQLQSQSRQGIVISGRLTTAQLQTASAALSHAEFVESTQQPSPLLTHVNVHHCSPNATAIINSASLGYSEKA